MAYVVGAAGPRLHLGLARFEGPTPSEQLIAARLRTALTLCDLTLKAPLSAADRSSIHQIAGEVRGAAAACGTELLGVLAERKKLKPIKLPLWKELGAAARSFLRAPAGAGRQEVFLTQYPVVLHPPRRRQQ